MLLKNKKVIKIGKLFRLGYKIGISCITVVIADNNEFNL